MSELHVEDQREVRQDRRGARAAAGTRKPSRQRAHERIELPPLPERALEPLRLDVALARRLERALEDLAGALLLALALCDRRELEQHLRAHHGCRRLGLLRTLERDEERPVGALRPVELPVVPGQLGERTQDLRVRRVDPRRGVELDEAPRAIAHLQLEAGKVVVNGRPLLGPPSTEALDESAQQGAGIGEAAGGPESVRERQPDGTIVGFEVGSLLEKRNAQVRFLAVGRVQLRRLEQPCEAGRLVRRVLGAGGQKRGERLPCSRLSIRQSEASPDGLDGWCARERLLEPRAGNVGAAGSRQRIGQAKNQRPLLVLGGSRVKLVEVLRRARVIAMSRRQPRERVERARTRLERYDPLVVLDRSVRIPLAVLAHGRGTRPQVGRRHRLTLTLGQLRLVGECQSELAKPLLRLEDLEQRRAGLRVAWNLRQVAPKRVEAAFDVAQRNLQSRGGETKHQALRRRLRVGDLPCAKGEQLAVSSLGVVELDEGAHRVCVAGVLVEQTSVQQDRPLGVAELRARQPGSLVEHPARDVAREGQARRVDE
jgi:hypothetical protein